MPNVTPPPKNVFDNSKKTDFQKCNRYFLFRHELGLQPPDTRPSTAIEFGNAFHLGKELLDRGSSLAESIVKAVEYFLPFEPESTLSAAGNEIEPLYSSNRLATVLAEHHDEYKDDAIKTWEGQVELGLAEELDSGIYFCGRIDRMIMVVGKVRPADYKTTKVLSSYVYNPHDQLTGYQWLCKKFFMEKNIGGVMFDMIGLAKTKREYRREFVTYSQFQENDWRDSILRVIENIFECRKRNHWPRETSKCNDFFTPCMYIPLCTAPDEKTFEKIKSGYTVDYWFPYNIDI